MNYIFYISGAIAAFSTAMVITSTHAVYALLYLIVSLLSVAVIFFDMGAPFMAALEVIIYAGAIMVLFVFVMMMLNLGSHSRDQERSWIGPKMWIGPLVLTIILLAETAYIAAYSPSSLAPETVSPKAVGVALYGPYVAGVELASLLLLAGLVGAYHLGRREKKISTEERG